MAKMYEAIAGVDTSGIKCIEVTDCRFDDVSVEKAVSRAREVIATGDPDVYAKSEEIGETVSLLDSDGMTESDIAKVLKASPQQIANVRSWTNKPES